MKIKVCLKCHKKLCISSFSKNRRKKDGYSPYCKTCYKISFQDSIEKSRRKNIQKKIKIIKDHFKRNPCKCGETDPAALQFDHKDPTNKKFKIAKCIYDARSLKTLLAEIKKCRVVCVNCHKQITAVQQRWYTLRWYKKYLKGEAINIHESK